MAEVSGRIVGFATLTGGTIERQGVPEQRLRRRLPAYPLPVVRLARLAVDERARGQGIGRVLLKHALGVALAQREQVGCVGVVVDDKPEALAFYQALGFVPLSGVQGLDEAAPTPLFLPVQTLSLA